MSSQLCFCRAPRHNPALPALPLQWQRSLLQFTQQERCNATIAQKQLHFTAEQQLPAHLKNQLLNVLLHHLPIPEVWLFLGPLLILLQGIHSLLPPKAHPFQKQGKIPLLLSPVSLFKFCFQITNAVPSTGVLLFQEV